MGKRVADDFSVLVVDTESTDLASAGGELIEVAALLYSVKHRCVVSQVSSLIPAKCKLNKAEAINQIPLAAAAEVSAERADAACFVILDLAKEAKYIVAHNAELDRNFLAGHEILSELCDGLWLCSCYDFDWPKQHRPGMNLVHLALAHGVGVTAAHRALSDCQLVASLFSVLGDELAGAIAKAARPKCRVVANVEYTEKDKVREAGFNWDPIKRHWSRWIAIDELPRLPVQYSVLVVEPRGNNSIAWARLWQMYVSHVVGEGVRGKEECGQEVWRMVRDVPAMLSSIQNLWRCSCNGSVEPEGLMEMMGALETWYWAVKNQREEGHDWASSASQHEMWGMLHHVSMGCSTWRGGRDDQRGMVDKSWESLSPGEVDFQSDSVQTDVMEEKVMRASPIPFVSGEDPKNIGGLVDEVSEMSVGSERSSCETTESSLRRKRHKNKLPKKL